LHEEGKTENRTLSVADVVARAWSFNFSLNIPREEAAFLAGIHTWFRLNPDSNIEEEQLRDIYRIVSEVSHSDAGGIATRTTNAIARLREQRLIARTDSAGIARVGEYSLTRMGSAIAEWLGDQEGLTRQSLQIILTRIRADLSQIRLEAERDGTEAHWLEAVKIPLRNVVSELMEAVERRQQGMDVQQEQTRLKIGEMLEEKWLEAVQSCEALLEKTGRTLTELHHVLLSETEGVNTLLNAVEDLAERHGRSEALETIFHVRKQMERISEWGATRFSSFSEYYQAVHEFIRDVIQIDPGRAMRSRMKEGIKNFGSPAWTLNVSFQPPMLRLRDPVLQAAKESVSRPSGEREIMMHDSAVEQTIFEKIREELSGRLDREGRADIMTRLLPDYTTDQIYLLIAEVTEWLIDRGTPSPRDVTAWDVLGTGFEIQNLTVIRKRGTM
jgi:chromosome partition protein MukF